MATEEMPTYQELMLPTLRAVLELGGSGSKIEIHDIVVRGGEFSEDLLAKTYNDDPASRSILEDRADWARSYCKLSGALESPKRGLFLITSLGREIAELPDTEAIVRMRDLDRIVKARRRTRATSGIEAALSGELEAAEDETPASENEWKQALLGRLHRLSPEGFEEFVLYLLRRYGLSLRRVGGSGDEGIDGIGTAPLSDVLSVTVAVQAKRYDPSSDKKKTISRDAVALFQRDASAAGAERAVLVTLVSFTEPARKAATTATPTVDLIDGDRLCELALAQGVGITMEPRVNEGWFDRFDG